MAGSYLLCAMHEGASLEGLLTKWIRLNHSTMCSHSWQKARERERVTDTERDRKWLYNQFKLCCCVFVSLPQPTFFLLKASWNTFMYSSVQQKHVLQWINMSLCGYVMILFLHAKRVVIFTFPVVLMWTTSYLNISLFLSRFALNAQPTTLLERTSSILCVMKPGNS